MAYEPEAKRLHGDRGTDFGIVIGYGLRQIKIQYFLSEPEVYPPACKPYKPYGLEAEPEARRIGIAWLIVCGPS